MSTRLSVVIPAHDEAAVIDRLLRSLTASPRRRELEIVVVANGCRDDTAQRARRYDGVRVVEIPAASKTAALDAGDGATGVFPRVYVDADVQITSDALFALADVLDRPGVEIASPGLHVDTSGASWLVRQHYRVWELSDYRRPGHIGSGVYALSQAGRDRFGAWPDVIADDRFVQQLFAVHERATLTDHSFTVRSSADMRSHLRRSVRIARGNQELPDHVQHPEASRPTTGSRAELVRQVAARPGMWVPFAVYCVSWMLPNMLASRNIARERASTWNRDETTRVMT